MQIQKQNEHAVKLYIYILKHDSTRVASIYWHLYALVVFQRPTTISTPAHAVGLDANDPKLLAKVGQQWNWSVLPTSGLYYYSHDLACITTTKYCGNCNNKFCTAEIHDYSLLPSIFSSAAFSPWRYLSWFLWATTCPTAPGLAVGLGSIESSTPRKPRKQVISLPHQTNMNNLVKVYIKRFNTVFLDVFGIPYVITVICTPFRTHISFVGPESTPLGPSKHALVSTTSKLEANRVEVGNDEIQSHGTDSLASSNFERLVFVIVTSEFKALLFQTC